MFSRIHSKLGTVGLIVAIVALVAALAGGAYAASGLNGTQKKQVRNIAKSESKKFSKKFSKRFAQAGPAGETGATGAAGAKGATGPEGPEGPQGEEGEEGEKGEKGADGAEGSPWTAGGTLPSGETEIGTYAGTGLEGDVNLVQIGFTLPVVPAPEATLVPDGSTEAEGCPGVVEGVPTAEPGNLCVYEGVASGNVETVFENPKEFLNPYPGELFEPGIGPSGSVLVFVCKTECSSYGVWAVTAE